MRGVTLRGSDPMKKNPSRTAALPFEIVATRDQPLGMPAERFLRDYWHKRPLLIRNAFPGFETPVQPADDDSGNANGDAPLATGAKDRKGLLVVDGDVRAALWYQGSALYTEFTGSPAQLPLLRLNQKAYAETHGYRYSEGGVGRFWDEFMSEPDTPVDQEVYRVYLPITR